MRQISQTIILWAMHYTPGLRLRVPEETEIIGLDEMDMGEFAYDYVGMEPELKSSQMTPGYTSPDGTKGMVERDMEQQHQQQQQYVLGHEKGSYHSSGGSN